MTIPRACGRSGQPSCPPIDCVTTTTGKTLVTIEGVEYELVPLTSTEGIESNTAQDQPEKTVDSAG